MTSNARLTIGLGFGLGFALAATPDWAAAGEASGEAHAYGALSVAPPLLAVGLAILTRRVILSLLLAVFTAVVILADGNVFAASVQTCEGYLWAKLADADNLRVFAFTMLMGAMVGVIHRAGGMHGLVEAISPWARTRRRGQLTCWALGLIIFFDDYANTLLLGNTLRPVTDRLRISREKLAYLVDSTAAPVAGLAIVSTWVASEVQYISEGFKGLHLQGDPDVGFSVFLASIPYRFYPLLALLFVGLVAWLGRDFGSMLSAERRAAGHKRSGIEPQWDGDAEDSVLAPAADRPRRWVNAVVPICVVLVVATGLILATGKASLKVGQPASLWNMVGHGDSYLSLVYAALAGLLAAIGLGLGQRLLNWEEARAAASVGARMVVPALAILWLASCLKEATGPSGLQTATYLGGLLDGVAAAWLPTLVFAIASAVAFGTGTSWGTMGILTPLVVEVTAKVITAPGAPVNPQDPLLLATIGSVLAGAIFGDHCSPISDTTVLSSLASGCDHISHVRTQMPYALLVAAVAVICGTAPAGFGVSPLGCVSCLLIGAAVLTAFLLFVARRVDVS